MKIYISGAISGLPKESYERRFNAAATHLRGQGHEVVSPIENTCQSDDWCEQMIECLQKLIPCEAIYLLRGWESSTGARVEYTFALKRSLIIIEEVHQNKNLSLPISTGGA